jgi:hypothetical protein
MKWGCRTYVHGGLMFGQSPEILLFNKAIHFDYEFTAEF